ncbi:MAG: polysaccharide deacetylase family protein [Eubacteriales bacterium]|jgi:peptidoglycan-N-acetylmuramic acid deacetylase
MNNKLMSILIIACCAMMILTICTDAAGETLNWYCKRNKNHLQPRCDPDMQFIEKYDGYYVDKNHGDTASNRVVYLTFDAGYDNGNVGKVLDVLKEKEVRAAFFILAHLVKKNTDLVRRMADEGHLVCNHTASHKDMTKFQSLEEFGAELKKLEDIYTEYTGREIARYYRPPEGKFNEENLKFAQQIGYKTIFWSLAYADWDNERQPDPEEAYNLIMSNIHNGAIILLHPISSTNAKILGRLIDQLRGEGYSFGTLDQLTNGEK